MSETADIVARLRGIASYGVASSLYCEAAGEIERLRSETMRLIGLLGHVRWHLENDEDSRLGAPCRTPSAPWWDMAQLEERT